jgi:PAS domain S-box-containing protein
VTESTPRPQPDFKALFEGAPGRFLVLDPDLTIVAASDAYLQATMTERAAILGRPLFEVFPDNPDDPAASGTRNLRASLERVRASLVSDTMAVQKYDIKSPDGAGFEERFWSPVNWPLVDAEGKLAYIIHRVEDVTEFVRLKHPASEMQRIDAELATREGEVEAEVFRRASDIAETNRRLELAVAELQRSEMFLDSVVENIPDVVFVKDAEKLHFVRFNRAGEELHARSRTELIGKSDHDFFPREQADFFTAKDREALKSGHVLDIPEEPLDTPSQGRRILHTKKIPIFDKEGRPAYLLGISEDITERKQAEDALMAARSEAERANRAKTDFLSQMSHELRTPLTAILGFSQLLELDELTPDQRSSVSHILQAGRHLLDLINEILDISRIETGQMTISHEPVALDELLDEVSAVVHPLVTGRNITLSRASVGDVHVLADRQRLRQVLLNILSNAVKYNRAGGQVTIRCEQVGTDRLQISVADTGYGIAPEHLERLFHPFDRLGAELGSVEGTGIGLAVAQGLVRAMGGSIKVASEIDVGSTFTIELGLTEGPLERYEQTADAFAESVVERPQRRVLQIEDNLSNVRLVERILQRRPDIDLMTAGRGRLGIDLARRHLPHLILLDLHLPDMPGHEVLRELRTYPETRQTPIVVVSADATKTQMTRLTEAGVFGYLTKPLDVAEFLRTIDLAIDSDQSVTS